MTSPAVGAARLLRALLLGSVTVALALGAHRLAGGEPPAALALVVALVVVGCVALLVSARPVGRVSAVAGLLVGQLGMHVWFSLTGSHGCAISLSLTGHDHSGVASCEGTAALVSGAGAGADPASAGAAGLTMLAAHLAAVLVTGLVLAHGDTLLWRLAGLLGRAVARLVTRTPVRTAARLRPSTPPAVLCLARPMTTPLQRRGPPQTAGAR